jgi:hypothetical protein
MKINKIKRTCKYCNEDFEQIVDKRIGPIQPPAIACKKEKCRAKHQHHIGTEIGDYTQQ